jgi:hypothetical protein
MTEPTPTRKFHWRGLTSFTLSLAFLVMVITGIVLYASPQGRVANWTGWQVWSLQKEQWSALHITAAILFILSGVIHLYFNWSALVHYVVSRQKLNLKRELLAALAIVVLFLLGTVYELPPFQTLIDANDRIKAYWDEQSQPAPYPHAEESTLREFAARVNLPLEEITAKLHAAGLEAEDPGQTIGELAERYKKTPSQLFGILRTGTGKGTGVPLSSGEGHGRGLGKMTLATLCEQNSLSLAKIQAALQARGISVQADSNIREIADRLEMTPAELLDWLSQLSDAAAPAGQEGAVP